MRSRSVLGIVLGAYALGMQAQTELDTITNVYQLGELTIRGHAEGLDLEGFMRQVMEDTTFQHAFLNTRYHGHRVESSLRVRNKDEEGTATLYRKGRLVRKGRDATLVLDSVSESGRLRERDGTLRYLTAEMYDEVFFPKGTWPADNRIRTREQEVQRGGRIDKYKSELKKFMFNPGQEIASVPFIGDKLALYEPDMIPFYDHTIATETRNGRSCWRFTSTAKADARENATVIKRMTTWFDQRDMQVMAREYRIAHSSMILDFDISIQVDNARVSDDLVPVHVRYDGDWDIPLRKRELVRFVLDYSDWTVAR
jgi:hypothetical protein